MSLSARTKLHVAVTRNADVASFLDISRQIGVNHISMKKRIAPVFAFVMLCMSMSVAAQQFSAALVPAKGYYRDLQSFNASPLKGNEALDAQKFPFDPASAEKRLSIKPYYLTTVTPDDFDVPAPPANSSEQTRAELNYLLTLQEKRTKLDVESSMYLAGVFYSLKTTPEDPNYKYYRQNLFHVGRSIGNWFNPTDLPLTADLIAHVWQDASYFIWSLKYKYLRVRPYTLEASIDNLEDANWAAYPSGHAGNSYVNAFIYQELAPEFADAFIKDAFDMAHSREILGVHYPSDSEASRLLARQLVNKLFQNERFMKDFELVKKEWANKAKESFNRPQIKSTETLKSPAACGTKPNTSSACAKTCQ
jgi:acid phosphatase (class A)